MASQGLIREVDLKIFIIVGMPAAGKSIAEIYAKEKGYPYHATGDVVRTEVQARGLKPGPGTMAQVAGELKGEDGMGVTRIALEQVLEEKRRIVFLEGMRSWQEVELIREQAAAVVVAFLAPRPVRKRRMVARGRPDDSPEAFEEREWREISYGAAVPIALADAYIVNTSTMEDSKRDLDAVVRQYDTD